MADDEDAWRWFQGETRAVIEALREPSPAMVRALYETHGDLWAENEAVHVWQIMIDTALAEGDAQEAGKSEMVAW